VSSFSVVLYNTHEKMYLLFSLSTDDVTFAANGGHDQPFCGLLLDDRAVSHLLSGSYSPATGDTIPRPTHYSPATGDTIPRLTHYSPATRDTIHTLTNYSPATGDTIHRLTNYTLATGATIHRFKNYSLATGDNT
jgi:hypothetical protein